MPTPNNMPRVSAVERDYQAYRAALLREERLDEIAREGGSVTASKAYRAQAAKLGLLR